MEIHTIKQFDQGSRGLWQSLSAHDRTCAGLAHEVRLVDYLLADGGLALLVTKDNRPVFRTLLAPITEGHSCLGFFAWDPAASDSAALAGGRLVMQEIARLRPKAQHKIVAPMNGATWFRYRLRVDDHPHRFDWEPPHHPQLYQLLKDLGFQLDTKYHSQASSPLRRFLDDAEKDSLRTMAEGFVIHAIDAAFLDRKGLELIFKLSSEAFASNSYYRPISFAAFTTLYQSSGPNKASQAVVALDPDGEAVGFTYTFLEPQVDALVFKTGAVSKTARGHGLSNAMARHIALNMIPSIPTHYIAALVKEGLNSESYARHGQLLWEHRYELLSIGE